MTRNALIIGLIVLAIIVAIIIPIVHRSSRREGFDNVFSTGVAGYDSADRPGYFEHTKKNANPLASVMNPTKVNLADSDDPNVINAMSEAIQDTMNSATLVPDPEADSYLGIGMAKSLATLPPPNQIIAEAKKCQTLHGRDACAALNDPNFKNCGICLLKGTPYSSSDPNPDAGKWIGGLLVLPDERSQAERSAGKGPAQYTATIGECAPGYLQVDAAACKKTANRADCAEFGASGGFGVPTQDKNGNYSYSGVGKTVEGRTPDTCAQVPSAGPVKLDQYIYDPKTSATSVNLRVAFPYGTGYHRIRVYDESNRQVASNEGTDQTLVLALNGVKELGKYRVFIGMETPYRKTGQKEAFIFQRSLKGAGSDDRYNQTQTSAAAVCTSIGTRQATRDEAQEAFNNGAQTCMCAWTTSENVYPSQAITSGCGAVGVNNCNWTGGVGASWCFGVKPPQNRGDAQLQLQSTPHPWFGRYDNATPNQDTLYTQWSRFGEGLYEADYERAFIAQWETTSDKQAKRVIPFEPTIVSVHGNPPRATGPDGAKTFTTLKRFGTFSKSTIINSPRPNQVPGMLTNQFWIWSNRKMDASTYFDVQIPNLFTDSYYKEDRTMSKAGPLIGNPFSMTLMATSPCLAANQLPGKYSMACLRSMFIGSGGDPNAGKLATEGTGLLKLNKIGDGSIDTINAYLAGLYDLVMSGRDTNGMPIGMSGGKLNAKLARKTINSAAQLLFGFDMVSPCEYMYEDDSGKIVIAQNPANGQGPLDAECMDYLYMNTYSSKSREESSTKPNGSTIRGTYTNSYYGYPQTLAMRYSGLRDGEGKKADRETWPFQACQRAGTLSPLSPDGTTVNAAAVKYVNEQAYPRARAGESMVAVVQSIYDAWHKAANYYTNDLQISDADRAGGDIGSAGRVGEIAVKMCYGISKEANRPNKDGCGIKARYVRVMGSWTSMAPTECLQIPQIQVFTTSNQEVAKGKRASSNTQWPDNFSTPDKAVNGNARPHSHGEGEFHSSCIPAGGNMPAYNSWWMVDLGGTFEIGSVKFFPRTDCCTQRQYLSPVQLLNDSMKVVSEQRIWDNKDVSAIRWTEPTLMTFSGTNATPRFSMKALLEAGAGKGNIGVSMTNATTGAPFKVSVRGNRYGQVRMVNLGVTDEKVSRPDIMDSMLNIIKSWDGSSGTISIHGPHFGYLCHSGTALWARAYGTGLAPDAVFKPVPALNGDPAGYSLQATTAGYTNHYMVNHWQGQSNMLGIQVVNTNDPTDMRRAVWYFNEPVASKSVSSNSPPFTGQPLYGNIGY